MFLKTFEVRNGQCTNRIFIHIWSALPSLTVWSEFRELSAFFFSPSTLWKWVHPAQCTWFTKLRSNCQTRQCWSNMNQDSITALSISRLKCFQKHILVYCLVVIWERFWPGCNLKTDEPKPSTAQLAVHHPHVKSCDWFAHSTWKHLSSDGCNPLRACPCNVTAFIHNTAVPAFSLKCY